MAAAHNAHTPTNVLPASLFVGNWGQPMEDKLAPFFFKRRHDDPDYGGAV
jgi:hypothetical protein